MSGEFVKDVWRVSRTIKDRSSQDRSGQVGSGQVGTGQVKIGQVRTCVVKLGPKIIWAQKKHPGDYPDHPGD